MPKISVKAGAKASHRQTNHVTRISFRRLAFEPAVVLAAHHAKWLTATVAVLDSLLVLPLWRSMLQFVRRADSWTAVAACAA